MKTTVTPDSAAASPPRPPRRDSASFLVRLWVEPGETADGKPQVRGFVRNLRTGEEHYLNDPEELEQVATGSLGGIVTAED